MESSRVKVWLTCPMTHADQVRIAIGDAGIGTIGNYTHCSFVTIGKGYFRPNENANPYLGERGEITEVNEVVIEFVCEKKDIEQVRHILQVHHPYEEVALDVFPLLDL